jgi:hypothetical protein
MMGGRWEDRHFSALGVMLMDGWMDWCGSIYFVMKHGGGPLRASLFWLLISEEGVSFEDF